MRGSLAIAFAGALVAMPLLAGCSRSAKSGAVSKTPVRRQLTLVAYSVPEQAYKKIIPAFQAYWKNKTGEEVDVAESYGASGSQARAVIDGLGADVVHLAMEPDVSKIAQAGLIKYHWQAEGKSVPQTSLIVLGVRPGNPKKIQNWADLTKPGIQVVTPDPRSSGGAKWNVLSAWGDVTLMGGTEDGGYKQLLGLFRNAPVLDKSARDASNTFLKKQIGDAAILWESDANIAKAELGQFDIVIPKNTILAQTAAAVVDANTDKKGTTEVAKAFVAYLSTPEAQKAFAESGIRPSDPEVLKQFSDRFPQPSGKLFTIADLGGWKQAGAKFFDDGGVYDRVAAEVAGKG